MDEYLLVDLKRCVRRNLSRLRMRRLDRRSIPGGAGEIRLFLVIRDEMLRLPYFFQYYRDLGVNRFLVVDNDSSDGSREWLLRQPDAHVFETRETYTRQEAWVDSLLRRFGRDGWSVIVDVDELLIVPGIDHVRLPELCAALDREGSEAVHALLLDMYPDAPLRDASYRAGTDPRRVATHFDPASHYTQPYRYRNCRRAPGTRFAGGMRERVFGLKDVACSKFPLLRFGRGVFLRQGTHAVEGVAVSGMQAVLLHFKFLHDFGSRVAYEAERGEHWNDASQYKEYARKVGVDPSLSLAFPGSVRYEGPDQLLRLGLLRAIPGQDQTVR